MDQETLVTEQIHDGNELVNRFDKFAPLTVAVWLKPVDADRWSLYLVSSQIKTSDLRLEYGEVVKLAAELHNPELGLFRVKLVPAESPFARAAIEACRYYPAGRIIELGVKLFGDVAAEEAYFYPIRSCVPATN